MQKINSLEEYHQQHAKSVANPEEFWNEKAETFNWKKKWDKTL
ncbi:MAG: acetyl-coenzyme A synthetase N-terminal domain-containing protein, partial [Flavobacteriales bacterium]